MFYTSKEYTKKLTNLANSQKYLCTFQLFIGSTKITKQQHDLFLQRHAHNFRYMNQCLLK